LLAALVTAPARADEASDTAEVLDEVVVSVTHHRATASESRLTARDISSVPRRTAEDALRLVPGMTLVQHGSEGKGHQFFLRGFDAIHGADLELSVEGIPVNEWSNVHAQGYLDLGFIIPEVIDSVVVTKGPFSIDQGPFAMAGSAEYRLGVPPSDLGVRATYGAGTTRRNRGVITYSPEQSDGSSFVALEALHDEGFGQNRQITRGALLAQVRLMDSPTAGSLSWLGSLYLARFGLPGTLRDDDVSRGAVGFYDAYDRRGRGDSERVLGALVYESRPSAPGGARIISYGGYRRLRLLENFTGFLLDPVSGDRRRQAQSTWNMGVQAHVDTPLHERFTLYTGGGVRADAFEQSQEHVGLDAELLAQERQLEGLQALGHVKAGISWQPGADVRVKGGARWDVAAIAVRDALATTTSGQDSLGTLSPRLTLDAQVREDLTVFGAVGRGVRPPEARAFSSFTPERTGISEDVYTGGGPRMTVCDSAELGARWEASDDLELQLAAFATYVERETLYDHVSGINLELDGTRRLGAEGVVQARPLPWLALSGDLTVVDARFRASQNAIPLSPWLTAGVRAVAGGDLGLRGGLRWLGLAPRPLPHGARGAALLMLDATVGYHFRRIRLDLELENLANLRVREGEYHYASRWRLEDGGSELPVLHFVAGPPFNARASVTALF
jgi:outer membrane receptor protein involved in Fe transport